MTETDDSKGRRQPTIVEVADRAGVAIGTVSRYLNGQPVRAGNRNQIAQAIQEILQPQGVGVVVEASHSCMTLRGVNTQGATLVTSHLIGVVRDDPRTRQEFLRLVGI